LILDDLGTKLITKEDRVCGIRGAHATILAPVAMMTMGVRGKDALEVLAKAYEPDSYECYSLSIDVDEARPVRSQNLAARLQPYQTFRSGA
jgi:hypothetical protein